MKIGIVGLGSIGQRHAENARKLGHHVAGYDPLAVGGLFKREWHLYDWCDACIVCTPSMSHEGPLRACVERSKHVLVEKPISTGEGGLRQILTSAAHKQLTVMVGNNLRFHPAIVRAKQYVDSGLLGELRWANFICATEYTSTAANDGVILNTGSHEVDIALHLFGPAVVNSASARALWRSTVAAYAPEHYADFVLLHDGGVRSSFHINIDTPGRVRQFWISGTAGSRRFDLDRRTADETYFGGDYAADYVSELEAFTDRIAGKDVPGATGEEGLECLRLLVDIRKKAGLS